METEPELRELREEMAQKTREMVRLVAERNGLASQIGKAKTKDALPLEDERVEDQLLQMVESECERLGVDREAGARILNILLSESKRVQGGGQGGQAPQVITPMTIASKAREMERRGGEKVVRLDVGEPDFHPPAAVLEACTKALSEFRTHYTQTRGIPALTDSLQRYLKKRSGYSAQESQLIVTPGGRYAVYAALSSILGEGDRCLVIEPNWPAYKEAIQFIGARATTIPTTLEGGWEPSLEKVKESILSSTRAIVVSYPANPTGKLISPKLFAELIGVANDHDLTIISDEIYTDYSYAECPTILGSRAKKFILTASFSKTWAMTGFRVGYAVSSPEVISEMMKMQALMITSVPEFIQYGAMKALEVEKEIRENSEAMRERIEVACTELDKIREFDYFRPDGAMYVFPRVRARGFDATAFALKVLEQKKVSISPGSGFGDYPDCFRISLGNSKEAITEGIRRLGEAVR